MTKYLITNWDRLCEGKSDIGAGEERAEKESEKSGGLDTFSEGGLFKMSSEK